VGLLRLAGQVLPQLRDAAYPVLHELAEKVGATAHLSVAQGNQAQAVVVVEPSSTNFHVAYRVGSRHPLTAGAAGKAMAMRTSEHGWTTSNGELQEGAYGIAAPIRGVPGLRASVGVVTLEPLDTRVVGPQIVEAAAALSEVLRS